MLSQRPYGYLRIFSAVAGLLIFLVGLSSGFTYLQTTIPDVMQAVDANPSLFLDLRVRDRRDLSRGRPAPRVGRLRHLLDRGAPRPPRQGEQEGLEGRGPDSPAGPALSSDGPVRGLPHGADAENSSVLLVSYVLVGLAVTFAVVTALYGRIRSRNPSVKE